MFSLLPLVLRGKMESEGSAAFMMSAKALPYSGKPPPGVAVPRLIVVLGMALPPSCAAAPPASSRTPAQTIQTRFMFGPATLVTKFHARDVVGKVGIL